MLALLGAEPFSMDPGAAGQAAADAAAQAALAAVSASSEPAPASSAPVWGPMSPGSAGRATVDAALQAALEAANQPPPPPVYSAPSWGLPSPYGAGTATVDAATKAAIEAARSGAPSWASQPATAPARLAPTPAKSSGPSNETLTKVSDYASKAADALRSYFRKDQPAAAPAPRYAHEESGVGEYLPYVAGGGLAAVLLALLLKR